MGKEPDEIRREIEETRSEMGETVEAIGYKADVKARTREAVTRRKDRIVGSVRDATQGISSAIAGTGGRVATSARDGGSTIAGAASERVPSTEDIKGAARRGAGMARQNPVGLVVGSFAVGFLGGILLPSTRAEDERLGPLSDQVMDRVRETGEEAVERGREVVRQTAETARGAAQEAAQTTAQTFGETSQQHGEELTSSARDRARDIAPPATG
jgi:hypothetical protein